MKKLYRSNTDVKILGICGGIAEYVAIDATIIRIIFAVSTLFGFLGVWIYLLLALIVPSREA